MNSVPAHLLERAESVLAACAKHDLKVATAESCTGGLIAACITAIPGCSQWMDRGFVTYSNEAKEQMLGVSARDLERHGAVSEEVARAMAEGALANSVAHITVAVTGIAGPTGGSSEKPVGLVHFAAARRGMPTLHERHVFPGDRDAVRQASVAAALDLLLKRAVADQPGAALEE